MARISLDPARLDVTARQGKTWVLQLTVRDSAGALINTTGYSARWQVRDPANPDTPIIDAQTGTDITVASSATAPQITITISATTTANVPARTYLHEVELTASGGTKPPFLAGTLTVTPEQVR